MSIFKAFNRLKVLIIGDLILDRYIIGRVDRISPEAPVPVVLVQREELRLGGAANVALNVQALGATPYLLSTVGDDQEGQAFVELIKKKNISLEGIFREENKQTTVKVRILAENHQLLRYDKEQISDTASDIEDQLLQKIEAIIIAHNIDVVIFQDYNKGLVTPRLIQEGLALTKKYKIPSCIDPKKNNFLSFRGSTLFKPNLREINESLGTRIAPHEPSVPQLIEAAKKIHNCLQNEYTLITLGAKGLFIHSAKGGYSYINSQKRQIADVCGAGDTVISVASLALSLGLPPEAIATMANIAGGQVCEQFGVVPVNKEHLEAAYYKLKTR